MCVQSGQRGSQAVWFQTRYVNLPLVLADLFYHWPFFSSEQGLAHSHEIVNYNNLSTRYIFMIQPPSDQSLSHLTICLWRQSIVCGARPLCNYISSISLKESCWAAQGVGRVGLCLPSRGGTAGPALLPHWAATGQRVCCPGTQHREFSVKLPLVLIFTSLV